MAIRIFIAALRGLSFDCGAPYIAAGARAAKAVAENPGMSDRAIAAELGVSDTTVLRARKSGASNAAPETRTGKDGKKYPAKRQKAVQQVFDVIQEPCYDCETAIGYWPV
jgi:hypothetical protein